MGAVHWRRNAEGSGDRGGGQEMCITGSPVCIAWRYELVFYVGPRVAGELRSQGPPPELPALLPRVGACALRPGPISLRSLHQIISSMRNSPARGSDGLCIRIFNLAFNSIGHVLLYLVNACILSHDIPAAWKHSLVHPIHKSGDPANPTHYQPISILPVISKILKRAIQRQLYYYLNSNQLLSPTQWGIPRSDTPPRSVVGIHAWIPTTAFYRDGSYVYHRQHPFGNRSRSHLHFMFD